MTGRDADVLKLWAIAVAAFTLLALGGMVVVYVVTSEPAPVRAAGRAQDGEATGVDPSAPTAPLIVLPPPAAAQASAPAPVPAPYTPPPGVVVETLAPPPPVAREPERRVEQLVAFREVRRDSAMDQLNAREALRRQRLGLPVPPPAPAPARPLASARRPGAHPEHVTP